LTDELLLRCRGVALPLPRSPVAVAVVTPIASVSCSRSPLAARHGVSATTLLYLDRSDPTAANANAVDVKVPVAAASRQTETPASVNYIIENEEQLYRRALKWTHQMTVDMCPRTENTGVIQCSAPNKKNGHVVFINTE
jgi:hypothetical protein